MEYYYSIIKQIYKKARFLFEFLSFFLYNTNMQSVNEQQSDGMRSLPPHSALQDAGFTFSLACVLPVVLSFFVVIIGGGIAGDGYENSQWYRYVCFLVPQCCFCLAAFFFFKKTKTGIKPVCLTRCKWYYFAVAVVLQFGLFSLSGLNTFFIDWLAGLGYDAEKYTVKLPDLSGGWIVLAILVIAVLPAIFEETLFRGILLKTMKDSGWSTAGIVFISGALFSLFHQNPVQTLYQFFCGACFALIAVRSGSMLPTVLSHFLNNAVVLILSACGLDSFGGVAFYVVSGICLAGALTFLVFFDGRGKNRGKLFGIKRFLLFAAIGMVVCAVQWITVLVSGFSG